MKTVQETFTEDQYPLIKEMFQRDGLVRLDLQLPDALIREAAQFTKSSHLESRIQDAWKKSEAIRKIAVYPAVFRLLFKLYGRKPKPFQTLNSQIGAQEKPHCDIVRHNCWPNEGMVCGLWVALEDVDETNGPVVYYPGSHKLPELYHLNFGIPASSAKAWHYSEYERRMADVIDHLKLKPEKACIRRGEAVLWAANLIHGEDSIIDQRRSRLSQLTHYFFEGSEFYWTPFVSDFLTGNIVKRQPEFIP